MVLNINGKVIFSRQSIPVFFRSATTENTSLVIGTITFLLQTLSYILRSDGFISFFHLHVVRFLFIFWHHHNFLPRLFCDPVTFCKNSIKLLLISGLRTRSSFPVIRIFRNQNINMTTVRTFESIFFVFCKLPYISLFIYEMYYGTIYMVKR